MDKSEIMLLCASPRRKGTSTMLLERIQAVTGSEVVFHLKRIACMSWCWSCNKLQPS